MALPNLLRKVNVLVVDDVPANLVALHAVLARECHLIEAASGPEAVEIAKINSQIDVILMDIQMPGMDGYETAAEIKRIPGCEEIPIIFITAVYKEDPFIKKGYEVGGVDYFGKPFDPEILRMKVAVYGSFRQKADVLRERERQLRESEELLETGRKLSSILEGLPAGIIIVDINGKICQTNGEVARIERSLTKSNLYEDVLGWWNASGEMIKTGLPGKTSPVVRAVLKGETSHNEVLKATRSNGEESCLLCSASPLFGSEAKIVGAVVVVQDVTESKRIEEDLEQRLAKFISLGVSFEHDSKH